MIEKLINDIRIIRGLYGPEEKWRIVASGDFENRIEAYLEDDNTPWFAIFADGEITQRINSKYVEAVVY